MNVTSFQNHSLFQCYSINQKRQDGFDDVIDQPQEDIFDIYLRTRCKTPIAKTYSKSDSSPIGISDDTQSRS